MESKLYTVLIVDDHPLITDAYKSALKYIEELDKSLFFDIYEVHNCDDAYNKIGDVLSKNKEIELVFLDISLPPTKDGKIISGEDLGLKIKEVMPKSKVIVSTTLNDNYRIRSIFKSLNPHGFLIKNDINPRELVTAIKAVIFDPPYYSKTVVKLLRNEVSSDFTLDFVDRKILHELSIGTMMKDLPSVLLLSLPALEKRKRRLKELFETVDHSDKELLKSARDKGFI